MQVSESPEFNKNEDAPVVIAIGAFDGFHLGHQKIIQETKNKADRIQLPAGIYSFYPHPLQVIKPDQAPRYLISEEQKIDILNNMDLDYYFRQKFTKKFSQISFNKFVKDILVNQINTKQVVVGKDFKFGHKGKGNVTSLTDLGYKYDFEVSIVPSFKKNGEKVSSSLIRTLIKKGKVGQVSDYFGRNFIIEGKVVYGDGRGKKLGFPTANLKLTTAYVLPAPGVYAGYVHIDNNKYKGIANFGYKPTFSGNEYNIEIHIIGFSNDIYHKKISFEMIKFIRKEMNFDSHDQLIEQINQDLLYTDNFLC